MKGGVEGPVQAMHVLVDLKSSEGFGMLVVDIKNAFKSISEDAASWTIRVRPMTSFLPVPV